jgi:hypothetical protein
MTPISGQDTLHTSTSDSIIINKKLKDSSEIKKDCKHIRVEQNNINNEMKKQIDYLNEFINRGEGHNPEKKL